MARYSKNSDIAGEIGAKKNEAHRWLSGEVRVWDTCRRFVDGLQYGRWTSGRGSTDGTWVTEPSEPGVSRVTVNLLLPISQPPSINACGYNAIYRRAPC